MKNHRSQRRWFFQCLYFFHGKEDIIYCMEKINVRSDR